jgi:hypothetical protein
MAQHPERPKLKVGERYNSYLTRWGRFVTGPYETRRKADKAHKRRTDGETAKRIAVRRASIQGKHNGHISRASGQGWRTFAHSGQ